MKKYLLILLATASLTACEKVVLPESYGKTDSKTITFNIEGDFGKPTFTRATLSADGRDMTDLWIFDYIEDECVQVTHQEDGDDDFGEPTITMTLGNHELYFVASRGSGAVVDDVEHTITWSTVRDTFWKSMSVNVTDDMSANHSVTLDRVVSKLKVDINDRVPEGCASLVVTPSTWFYGLDYLDGSAVAESGDPISMSVPSSYVGTTGTLDASVFTISDGLEWTTNITIAAKTSTNSVLGSAFIPSAPLKANRATIYSGNLFSSSHAFTMMLSDGWLDDKVLTW
jgi:hypothetical protein